LILLFGFEGRLTIEDNVLKAKKPKMNSIESWVHSKGFRYAFTDILGASANPGKGTQGDKPTSLCYIALASFFAPDSNNFLIKFCLWSNSSFPGLG